MLAQPHLVSLIVDRAGTAWDLAKLTGGGPEPNGSARHKLRRLFETKRNWWSLVPSEFWGTAALLLHSSKAEKILGVLRARPLSALDIMLMEAHVSGALDMVLSDARVAFPASESSGNSTMDPASSS